MTSAYPVLVTVGRRLRLALAVAGVSALLLAGCSIGPLATPLDTTQAEVTARYGPATAVTKVSGGLSGIAVERWRYGSGEGQAQVEFGADGRVVRTFRPFRDESLLSAMVLPDVWRAEDALRELGPPSERSQVYAFKGDVWGWRFTGISPTTARFLYLYIDPQGVIRRFNFGNDPFDGWRRIG